MTGHLPRGLFDSWPKKHRGIFGQTKELTTSSLEEPPWRRVPKRPLPTPERPSCPVSAGKL